MVIKDFLLAAACTFSLLSSTVAYADEAAMERYRDWLPSQILELPENQRRSEVPIAYIQAANTAEIFIKYYLNRLMYNCLSVFDGEKRAFQRDIGQQETGNLTVGQLNELFFRAERSELKRVSFFAGHFGSYIGSNMAQVRGTAVLVGEQAAYPINFVQINCQRDEEICIYQEISISIPNRDSWNQEFRIHQSRSDRFRITLWESDRIEARPIVDGNCRIPELKLNFSNREFFEIVTNAPEGQCEIIPGISLPRLEQPRISQVTEENDTISDIFDEINQEVRGYMSSEFIREVELLSNRSGS
jgi:hypothetical protein